MSIRDTIAANWPREVDFLKALVRVPSDNPPGDCAPAGEVAAQELQALGFTVERHKVPEGVVKAAGMVSATNLILRHAFGNFLPGTQHDNLIGDIHDKRHIVLDDNYGDFH